MMSALVFLYIVIPMPLCLILHDAEAAATLRGWMQRNESGLAKRFPRFEKLIRHFGRLDTLAFCIAAIEELLIALLIIAFLIVLEYDCVVWVFVCLYMAIWVRFIVHIILAVVIRKYVPGLITSIITVAYMACVSMPLYIYFQWYDIVLFALAGTIFMVANIIVAHRIGMSVSGYIHARLQNRKNNV